MHRLPTRKDEERLPLTKDCFGRDKFANDRDDMKGVGSFNRESKTLFLGNLKNYKNFDMQECVTKHFKEFGRLEYVRVFPEKCQGFVRYELRVCAEFAREAMDKQRLDHGEVLNIRWSVEDSTLMAKARSIVEKRQQLLESLKAKGIETKPLSFHYPIDYKPKDAKLVVVTPNNNNNTGATTVDTKESEKMDDEREKEIELLKKELEKHVLEVEKKKEIGGLEFHQYMHSTFKEEKLRERIQALEEEKQSLQMKALNSDVVDLYPDTSTQFGEEEEEDGEEGNGNE